MSENKEMEVYEEMDLFDPSLLDEDTRQYLEDEGKKIAKIFNNAKYDIGEELTNVRNKMREKNVRGFYGWCQSLGFKKSSVDNALHYYEFIAQNLGNREILEERPKSIIYEAAKPSTPDEIKKAVVNGDIKTMKEYKEAMERIKELEGERDDAKKDLENEIKRTDEMTDNINKLEKRVSDLTDELKDARDKNNDINSEDLEAQQKKIAELLTENKNLNGRLENETRRSGAMTDELNELKKKVSDLTDELEETRNKNNEEKERLRRDDEDASANRPAISGAEKFKMSVGIIQSGIKAIKELIDEADEPQKKILKENLGIVLDNLQRSAEGYIVKKQSEEE